MQHTFGIYLYNKRTGKILIGHATRSRNSWSIPKGLKDSESEDDLDAAFRELYEETNIERESLNILAVYPLPAQKYLKQNKELRSFLVIIDTDPAALRLKCHSLVNNSFPEIDRYLWVSVDEFSRMAHEAQTRNIEEISRLVSE
jgi:8-oxo-dGTP pyrophosphatase MutT (NUDIX family)